MANLNGFNAHEVDPNVGFDPIPAGKHVCIITGTEMKPTKAGDGEYLQIELEVIDGPHKGRKLWDRLTLKHPNEMTVKIARGTLSAICRAVGVMAPKDSVELHNLPLVASVGLKKRTDTGEMTNVIKGYAKRESAAATPGTATTNANGGTPPWKR
jgi:hypothetical protein